MVARNSEERELSMLAHHHRNAEAEFHKAWNSAENEVGIDCHNKLTAILLCAAKAHMSLACSGSKPRTQSDAESTADREARELNNCFSCLGQALLLDPGSGAVRGLVVEVLMQPRAAAVIRIPAQLLEQLKLRHNEAVTDRDRAGDALAYEDALGLLEDHDKTAAVQAQQAEEANEANNAGAAEAEAEAPASIGEMDEFYATSLAAPPLCPATSPLRELERGDMSGSGTFKIRVPPDDAPLHELVKAAHASCCSGALTASPLAPGTAEYAIAMQAEVAQQFNLRPVFWSKIWAAGLALSRFLFAEPVLCEGARVLELGAGIGVGAVAAALVGACVVATDIEPAGLAFAEQSARDNGLPAASLRTAAWDWNETPPESVLSGAPYDLLLAGDTLYLDDHAARLAQLFGSSELLKPGGLVVLTDGRERGYADGHTSELRGRLAKMGFMERRTEDLLVEMEQAQGVGVADSKSNRVKLLLLASPRWRPSS